MKRKNKTSREMPSGFRWDSLGGLDFFSDWRWAMAVVFLGNPINMSLASILFNQSIKIQHQTTLIDTWVFFFRSARKRNWNRTSNYWVGNLNFQFARGWIAVIWARDRLGLRRLFKATPICLFFWFFFWFGFRERETRDGGREGKTIHNSVGSFSVWSE